eukprot:2449311-Amphidinium_carterae.1
MMIQDVVGGRIWIRSSSVDGASFQNGAEVHCPHLELALWYHQDRSACQRWVSFLVDARATATHSINHGPMVVRSQTL